MYVRQYNIYSQVSIVVLTSIGSVILLRYWYPSIWVIGKKIKMLRIDQMSNSIRVIRIRHNQLRLYILYLWLLPTHIITVFRDESCIDLVIGSKLVVFSCGETKVKYSWSRKYSQIPKHHVIISLTANLKCFFIVLILSMCKRIHHVN
jgi:hypothetical protein